MKTKVIVLLAICLIIHCSQSKSPFAPESNQIFAIYLAEHKPYWYHYEIPLVDEIQLVQEPLLLASDITSYQWSSHNITFPKTVHENLKDWGNLLHRIFVVVAEGERIYWGVFVDDLDSYSWQNPVIRLRWRHPDGRNTTPESFTIDRAYPEYVGSKDDPDIRANYGIYCALRKAGILVP